MCAHQPVAEIPTGHQAGQTGEGWERGRNFHLVFRQAPALLQIRVKPGEIEIASPAIRVIHQEKTKEIWISHQSQPLHAACGSTFRQPDLLSLIERDTLLFARRAAEPTIPNRAPENAQRAENIKRRAPSVALLDGNDDRGRESPTHGCRRPKHAQRASPFGSWKPA